MPSILDDPELTQRVTTHDCTIETSERRASRHKYLGFWRTLAHRLRPSLTSFRRERHAPSCPVRHPFEAPMDRFARENPSLAMYALAMI